jgi:hypothetical protein
MSRSEDSKTNPTGKVQRFQRDGRISWHRLQADHGQLSANLLARWLKSDARAGFGRTKPISSQRCFGRTKPIWRVPEFGAGSNPEYLQELVRDSGDDG